MVCKVADFGLARDVYQKDYYRPSKRPRPMPIKWMSIEAIKDGVFTTKSDVVCLIEYNRLNIIYLFNFSNKILHY